MERLDYHLTDGIYKELGNKDYEYFPKYKLNLEGFFILKKKEIKIQFTRKGMKSPRDIITEQNLTDIFSEIDSNISEINNKYRFVVEGGAVRNCGIIQLDVLDIFFKEKKVYDLNKQSTVPPFVKQILDTNNTCRNENEQAEKKEADRKKADRKEADRKKAEDEARSYWVDLQKNRKAEAEAERKRLAAIAKAEAEAREIERQAEVERKRLAEIERQAEVERVKAEAERKRQAEIDRNRNSWKVVYNERSHVIYWQPINPDSRINVGRSQSDPPSGDFITSQERKDSNWIWRIEKRGDGEYYIQWINGKVTQDTTPIIDKSSITALAQQQQIDHAESDLNNIKTTEAREKAANDERIKRLNDAKRAADAKKAEADAKKAEADVKKAAADAKKAAAAAVKKPPWNSSARVVERPRQASIFGPNAAAPTALGATATGQRRHYPNAPATQDNIVNGRAGLTTRKGGSLKYRRSKFSRKNAKIFRRRKTRSANNSKIRFRKTRKNI